MWTITILFWLIIVIIEGLVGVRATPLVPCYFIFGDSLSDAGNNNGLKTRAKANYHPYGVDFFGGKPTGRFTNGQTAVDVIAERLGLDLIPPFSIVSTKSLEILKGVNYASGAAGILPETGQHMGEVICFDKQIENHQMITAKIRAMMNTQAQVYLQKCLYTINIGSNDYINNYFMKEHYNSSSIHNPKKYAQLLVNLYRQKLQTLYDNGARKVAMFGLGLIGCTIGQVLRNRPSAGSLCVDNINMVVNLFNNNLEMLVGELNHNFHDAKFTYINIQAMAVGPKEGVSVLNQPCCKLREDYMCEESTTPCQDRKSHLFWDGYHPTEAVFRVMGATAFKASTDTQANPLDISSLVQCNL